MSDTPIQIAKFATKTEILEQVSLMIENIEKLPPQAMYAPINHADFTVILLLIQSILVSQE